MVNQWTIGTRIDAHTIYTGYTGDCPLTVLAAVRTLGWAGVTVRRSATSFHLHAVSDATDRISPALDALVARFGRMLRHVALQRGIPDEELGEVIQNLHFD